MCTKPLKVLLVLAVLLAGCSREKEQERPTKGFLKSSELHLAVRPDAESAVKDLFQALRDGDDITAAVLVMSPGEYQAIYSRLQDASVDSNARKIEIALVAADNRKHLGRWRDELKGSQWTLDRVEISDTAKVHQGFEVVYQVRPILKSADGREKPWIAVTSLLHCADGWKVWRLEDVRGDDD